MATGYTKQSTYETGNVISASLFNNDFNALETAFEVTDGHNHDGTVGGGAVIYKIGDADFNNKIEIDGTNNLIKLFIEVGGDTSTEILNVAAGGLIPIASGLGLGTVANPFSTANITTVTATNLTVDTDTLYVDSTNNRVGIGTSSPDYELDVTGSAQLSGGDLILRSDSDDADTQYIRFENYPTDIRTAYIRADYTSQTAGGGTSLAFGANDHATATDTDSMVIDIDGNVGIGTDSPDSALEVQGSANGVHQIHIQNTFDDDNADAPNPSARLYLSAASNNAYIQCKGATTDLDTQHEIDIGSTAAGSFLTFSPAASEAMRIDSTGNVGINNTSPDHKLHVHGGDIMISSDTTTSTGDGKPALLFSEEHPDDTNSNDAMAGIIYDGDGQSSDANYLGLGVWENAADDQDTLAEQKTTTTLNITRDNKVGIGTKTPAAKLHVYDVEGDDVNDWAQPLATFESTGSAAQIRIKNSSASATRGLDLKVSGVNATIENSMVGPTGTHVSLHLKALGGRSGLFIDSYQNDKVDGTPSFDHDVGIATDNPDSKLHVYGGDIRITSDSDTHSNIHHDGKPSLIFNEFSDDHVNYVEGVAHAIITYNGGGETGDANYLGFGVFNQAVSTEDTLAEQKLLTDLNITRDGKIGIGTTDPQAKLHLMAPDCDIDQEMASDSTARLIEHRFKVDGVMQSQLGHYMGVEASEGVDAVDPRFEFRSKHDYWFLGGPTGSAPKITFKNDGKVGIATTSPEYPLDVKGNVNVSYGTDPTYTTSPLLDNTTFSIAQMADLSYASLKAGANLSPVGSWDNARRALQILFNFNGDGHPTNGGWTASDPLVVNQFVTNNYSSGELSTFNSSLTAILNGTYTLQTTIIDDILDGDYDYLVSYKVGINADPATEALDVGGNIAVSGTVDGVDIATLGANAIVDGDFTSNGFMKRDGAGVYSVDSSTYLTTHQDISGKANLSGADFTGNVTTTGTLATGGYTLSSTDGTVGQALVTDGAGNVSFGSVTAEVSGKADLSGADFTGDITVDTDTLVVDISENKVGVNTAIADLDTELHVTASRDGRPYDSFGNVVTYMTLSSDRPGLTLENTTSDLDQNEVGLTLKRSTNSLQAVSGIFLEKNASDYDQGGSLNFYLPRSNIADHVITMSGHGRLGVGVQDPQYPLHVKNTLVNNSDTTKIAITPKSPSVDELGIIGFETADSAFSNFRAEIIADKVGNTNLGKSAFKFNVATTNNQAAPATALTISNDMELTPTNDIILRPEDGIIMRPQGVEGIEMHWYAQTTGTTVADDGEQTKRLHITSRGIHVGDDVTGTYTAGDLQNNQDIDFGMLIGRNCDNLGSNNVGIGFRIDFDTDSASNWATGSQVTFTGDTANSVGHGGNLLIGPKFNDTTDEVGVEHTYVGGYLVSAGNDYSFNWAKGNSDINGVYRASNDGYGCIMMGEEIQIHSTCSWSFAGGGIDVTNGNYTKLAITNTDYGFVYGRGHVVNNSDYAMVGGRKNDLTYATGSFVSGNYNTVGTGFDTSAGYSFVAGRNQTVEGSYALAQGKDNNINNDYGAAIGESHLVEGDHAFAAGKSNNPLGNGAVCLGQGLKTPLFRQLNADNSLSSNYLWDNFVTTVGAYNEDDKKFFTDYPTDSSNPTSWVTNHRFVVGTGTIETVNNEEVITKSTGFVVANEVVDGTDGFCGIIMPALAKSNSNYATEQAAKDAGVPVGGLYHTNGVIKIVQES